MKPSRTSPKARMTGASRCFQVAGATFGRVPRAHRWLPLLEGICGIAFGAQTFTTNVITLRVSPSDLIGALGLALLVGVLGGLGPAWRAARLRPIEALRKA